MYLDGGSVDLRVGRNKVTVAITKRFQYHAHVLMEDFKTPAGAAEDQPAADMAIHMQDQF